MPRRIWASRDRYIAWTRKYEKTHPDGTVQVYTVEHIRLVHPRKQQIRYTPFGMRVVDRAVQLYNAKTRKPIKPRSSYYSFAESFYGGPGAKGDKLGGFNTGQFVEEADARNAKAAMAEMLSKGFEVR